MKTIIVSGGNRGIGLETCRQLAGLGHKVIMGSRDLEKGQKAAESIEGEIIVKQLDVSDEESILNLYAFVEKEFGSLDVLINNAGLGTRYFEHEGNTSSLKDRLKENLPGFSKIIKAIKPVLKNAGLLKPEVTATQIPLTEVRFLMETNLYGPWQMAQAFTPLLQKSKGGRIINVSSGLGELRTLKANYPAYRISKAGLNALTIMLADDLYRDGIIVNAMCPGWVRTDMGGPDAPRSVEQGAETAVWLATQPNIESGKFYRDKEIIDW